MTDVLNNLLMLVIFAAYCQLMIVLAFIAGQLMILVIEYAADWVERRQSHAGKQIETVSYGNGIKHKRSLKAMRRVHRNDQQA